MKTYSEFAILDACVGLTGIEHLEELQGRIADVLDIMP
jgi:hypothetical protein